LPLSVGRYELRLIGSVPELWDAARAMHHCADMFVDAHGNIIIVSVRDRPAHTSPSRHGPVCARAERLAP
jgi:hypothetical protein